MAWLRWRGASREWWGSLRRSRFRCCCHPLLRRVKMIVKEERNWVILFGFLNSWQRSTKQIHQRESKEIRISHISKKYTHTTTLMIVVVRQLRMGHNFGNSLYRFQHIVCWSAFGSLRNVRAKASCWTTKSEVGASRKDRYSIKLYIRMTRRL